jgi:hypothetical protein
MAGHALAQARRMAQPNARPNAQRYGFAYRIYESKTMTTWPSGAAEQISAARVLPFPGIS